MKLRLGFVSNSSSASYTITIDKNYDEVINIFFNETPISWDLQCIAEIYQDDINGSEKSLKEIKAKSEESLFLTSKCWIEERMDEIRGKLVRLQEIIDRHLNHNVSWTTEEKRIIVDDFLSFRGITVRRDIDVEGGSEKTIVTGSSSMHNGYGDVPEFMKEIALYYLFVEPSVMKCEIEK